MNVHDEFDDNRKQAALFSSMQAEQAVLGSLMLDNDSWAVIADKLSEDDFYHNNHKALFSVIKRLSDESKPSDIVTMSDELKMLGVLDSIGGLPYLIMIHEDTPTAVNIGAYADILLKKSLRRNVRQSIVDIDSLTMDLGVENNELLEKIDIAVGKLTERVVDNIEIIGIKPALAAMVERIEQRFESGEAMTGMPTGLIDLDELTNGLQRKDLVILAARPSMGKTAAMMRIVEAVALQDTRPNVLIFSIEMPESALTERMTASIGRIELNKMRTGKFEDHDWPKLTSATVLLSSAEIHYCDTSSVSLAGMRTVIRRIEREHGKLSLVAVDYLQLITESGENETLKIGKISTGLKRIAKDFDVPMLALSQLNRGLESRADKRPVLSDLRQSGAIEQDADLVMFLYRDEVYNKDSADKGVMEIIIGKQRNGSIGTVRAYYEGRYTRVDNIHNGQGGYE